MLLDGPAAGIGRILMVASEAMCFGAPIRAKMDADVAAISAIMAKNPAGIPAAIEKALATVKSAESRYGLAKGGYKLAEAKYQVIKAAILAKDAGNVNKYFLGYNADMPDGGNVP